MATVRKWLYNTVKEQHRRQSLTERRVREESTDASVLKKQAKQMENVSFKKYI